MPLFWSIFSRMSSKQKPCNLYTVSLWSKGSACLLPIIKYMGSLSSGFLPVRQPSMYVGIRVRPRGTDMNMVMFVQLTWLQPSLSFICRKWRQSL